MVDLDDLQAVACSLKLDHDQARVTKRWLVQVLGELRTARALDAGVTHQGHCPLLDASGR